MRYNLNGKNINIPDADIERSMKSLELTKEEAIQVWLEDEGYLENEEQEELERKAKENRITATIHHRNDSTFCGTHRVFYRSYYKQIFHYLRLYINPLREIVNKAPKELP